MFTRWIKFNTNSWAAVVISSVSQVHYSFTDPVVSTVKRSSKSRIHATVGILLAAFTITLFTVAFVFWRRYKMKGTQSTKIYSRTVKCLHCYLDSCPLHTSESHFEILFFIFWAEKDLIFKAYCKLVAVDSREVSL